MSLRNQFSYLKLIPLLGIVVSYLHPLSVYAAQVTHVVISEAQTANTTTKEEFIELFNPKNTEEDLNSWKIQYKTAADTSESGWIQKINLTGKIQPRGYFLLSAKDYLSNADMKYTDFMAIASGHIRIVDSNDIVVDKLAWGYAVDAEGSSPASTLSNGQSLQRKFGADGKIQDTDNNNMDFTLASTPNPETTPGTDSDSPDPDPAPPPDEFLPVDITELLIDPISPQTDDQDEFIELYNPNTVEVDLGGYKVKTGSNLQYSFDLPSQKLPAGSYAVFYSRDYNLTLSNSGGKAQIFDPNDEVQSELVVYDSAEAGQTWALIDDLWQWTASPTPGAENLLGGGKGGSATNSGIPLANLVINEMFINPSAPQSDSNDEFVEIYNPNSLSVELSDYQLQTGSSFKTHFTLPSVVLGSGQYAVFYSRDSNVALGNSGGNARLVDGFGNIISEGHSYDEAEEGDSWSKFDSSWQWTSTPTPGAHNSFTESAKSLKKAKVKSVATKKAASKKSVAKKAKKVKAKEAVLTPATVPVSPMSTAIVAAFAFVALVYGIYEFRYDIRNKLELAKRNFKDRWHSGP